MAAKKFSYIPVVFKADKESQSVITKEESVYEEMIMENDAEPDTNDKKSPCIKSCPSVAAIWGILLLIMVLRIYFTVTTSVIHKSKEKQITDLTAENKNLREKNQELDEEKKNLTEQIQHMNTTWKKFCVRERPCKPCQKGWLPFESGCYAINNAGPSELKTWEEARENCKEKISDLVAVINPNEKTYVSENSWGSSGNKGYWIGLRVENGKWKWVDGSDLTDNSWIQQPPSDGLCAISVQNQGFKSVSCNNKNQWICKKYA